MNDTRLLIQPVSIADAESPIRMVGADAAGPTQSAARPQELYALHALDALIASADAIDVEVITDNMAAHYFRTGEIRCAVVGADRIARNGDVCNKIGTYDKALAARDNDVPFYVALPSPTLDPLLATGDAITLETRSPDEVLAVTGRDRFGHTTTVAIAPEGTRAVMRRSAWPLPEIFHWLQREGGVADEEMHRVFNCGIGMVLAVSEDHAGAAAELLQRLGETTYRIGQIEAGHAGEPQALLV